MFNIAVCDDEMEICSQVERMILDYGKETELELEVEVYTSGEELYSELVRREGSGAEGGPIDLIFLDIELKALDGIDVGRKIRQEMKNERIPIVYISSKQGYAMELFENRPLNFLLKPLEKERISHEIEKAMELANRAKQYFEFHRGKEYSKVPFSQILYFESVGRKIRLVTESGEYEFYGKLPQVCSHLDEKEFLQIHQSRVVHIPHIKSYRYEQVIMTSGEELSISQPYRKAVRAILLKRETERFHESF